MSAPPGPGNEITTKATAEERLSPSGEVKETGTYAESGGPASYSCNGPTNNQMSMIDTAEVGPYATEVTLTGDFFGTFLAGLTGSFGNQGGEFGDPNAVGGCNTDPEKGYETQGGTFFYFWDPEDPESEDNTRMEVGTLIPPQDIGQPTFGLVADDYSNMTNSLSCEWNDPASGCTLEFHLEGSWDLTKVCEGTAASGGDAQGSAAGACEGSSKSEEKKEEKKKSGKEKGSGKGKGKGKGKGSGGKGKGSGGKAGSAKLSLVSATAKGAKVALELKCAGAAKTTCKGKVGLSSGKSSLGSKAISLATGKSKSLTLTLNKRGVALLSATHHLTVKVEVTQTVGGKAKTVASSRVTLNSGGARGA